MQSLPHLDASNIMHPIQEIMATMQGGGKDAMNCSMVMASLKASNPITYYASRYASARISDLMGFWQSAPEWDSQDQITKDNFADYGHLNNLGDVDACTSLPGMQYCWSSAFYNHAAFGVCVPHVDACSAESLTLTAQYNVSITNPFTCGNTSFTIDGNGIFFLMLLTILVLLIGYATYKDYFYGSKPSSTSKSTRSTLTQRSPSSSSTTSILFAFSLRRSINSLFHITGCVQEFRALEGIRVLSLLWIIFGHIGYYES